MDKKYCDKCGKEIKGKYEYQIKFLIWKHKKQYKLIENKYYDLCMNCQNEFKKLLYNIK